MKVIPTIASYIGMLSTDRPEFVKRGTGFIKSENSMNESKTSFSDSLKEMGKFCYALAKEYYQMQADKNPAVLGKGFVEYARFVFKGDLPARAFSMAKCIRTYIEGGLITEANYDHEDVPVDALEAASVVSGLAFDDITHAALLDTAKAIIAHEKGKVTKAIKSIQARFTKGNKSKGTETTYLSPEESAIIAKATAEREAAEETERLAQEADAKIMTADKAIAIIALISAAGFLGVVISSVPDLIIGGTDEATKRAHYFASAKAMARLSDGLTEPVIKGWMKEMTKASKAVKATEPIAMIPAQVELKVLAAA